MTTQISLFHNGIIHSTADPYASAMLVENGQVAWVGGEEAAAGLADASMNVVDLDGGLIAPSFMDSHIHLTDTGLAADQIDLSAAKNKHDVLDAVANWVSRNPETQNVLGRGWDHALWQDQTLPTADELSSASQGRTVVLDRVDLHSGLFSADLIDGRTDDGNALMTEDDYAATRAQALDFSASQLLYLQRTALKHLLSNGYTAAVQMGYSASGEADYEAFAALVQEQPQFDLYGFNSTLLTEPQQLTELQDRYGTALTGFGGDLCVDGSIGSGTALLREPYAHAPQGDQHYGDQLLSVEDITNHLLICTKAGAQSAFHVIGDGALEVYLSAAAAVIEQTSLAEFQRCGHRLEHLEMATEEDIKRLASYGVIASMQPLFDKYWANGMYQERLGAERADRMNPIGRMLAEGVSVAFGSDSPVVHVNGWDSIAAAMNLRNTSAQISARAAFRAHTMSGFRAVREARPLAGMLVPGARADFAIWDADELTVQASASTGSEWSTDVRSRTPLLPVLEADGVRPQLRETFYAGTSVYRA